jgi:hypothetical protein
MAYGIRRFQYPQSTVIMRYTAQEGCCRLAHTWAWFSALVCALQLALLPLLNSHLNHSFDRAATGALDIVPRSPGSKGAMQENMMSDHAPKKPADLHTDPAESAPPNIGVIALVVIIVVMIVFLAIALWAGHLSH